MNLLRISLEKSYVLHTVYVLLGTRGSAMLTSLDTRHVQY